MKNRRLKVLFLNPEVVLGAFREPQFTPGWIYNRVTLPDLPDDIEVVSVEYDFRRQMLGFVVSHASFDEVALGQMLPVIEIESTGVRYEPVSTWRDKGPLL